MTYYEELQDLKSQGNLKRIGEMSCKELYVLFKDASVTIPKVAQLFDVSTNKVKNIKVGFGLRMYTISLSNGSYDMYV